MRKIKVLHIIKSLGRGGAETLLPESLKLHDQARFEFHYIYFLPWKDQMVGAIEKSGGVVTCMSANNNIQLIRKAGQVISYCRMHQIDILHCHLPWAGFLGRYVHFRTGIPTIYTEHNKQERYHRITYYLNKISFNSQNLAIAVSEDVKQSILKNIQPKISVETVLNGVNTKYFTRQPTAGLALRKELGIPENALVVGTIAVFRFQKRLVEWLRVFKEVSEENDHVFGIIVGDGPLKDDILNTRESLGLTEKVFMPGLQTEVRPYLSAMDIYMMTSSFEGLPIALLEAMSMECAIVSTRAGGIGEVIDDTHHGLLTGVDTWEKLSDNVLQLTKKTDLMQRLGHSARKRVMDHFSMQQMVDHLEAIYRKFGPVESQD